MCSLSKPQKKEEDKLISSIQAILEQVCFTHNDGAKVMAGIYNKIGTAQSLCLFFTGRTELKTFCGHTQQLFIYLFRNLIVRLSNVRKKRLGKMSAEILNLARRRLTEALGENATLYFSQMKLWFKMKLTKEEFDIEARSLLSPEQIHFHNDFFLALLNKIEGLAELSVSTQEKVNTQNRNSRRHRRSTRSASEKSNFEPAEILDYLPPNSPPGAGSDGVKYAVQELFLPDHALVMGRFMLAAWEQGLESAEDEAADCIVVALKNFLKTIISSIITQRKGYKVREGNFVHDVGGDVPNVWLRNAARAYDPQAEGRTEVDEVADCTVPRCPPTIDEVEQSTAYALACSVPETNANENTKLSIDEFYSTLKVHRNIISNHSIYAVSMEKLATMLNHPSY